MVKRILIRRKIKGESRNEMKIHKKISFRLKLIIYEHLNVFMNFYLSSYIDLFLT